MGLETIYRFPSHLRETDHAHCPAPAADMSAISTEKVPMSVLGILLHFSRAVIRAHNNAKVRNLMDAMPAEARKGAKRQNPADAPKEELSDRPFRGR